MAPKPKPWLRLYVEAATDRKLRRLKPEHRWLWIVVLIACRQSPQPGRLMLSATDALEVDDLADLGAMPAKMVTAGMAALVAAGLVAVDGGVWVVPAWADRQYESDRSTDRVAKHRSSRADVTAMQRLNAVDRSADVTPPENRDREQRTEAEVQAPPNARKSASLVAADRPSAPAVPESSTYHPSFAEWWDRYPRKVGKQAAHKAWLKAKRQRGHVALLAALEAHADVWEAEQADPQFIPHPATWLNEGRYDDPPPTTTKARTRVDRTRVALVQGAIQVDQGAPSFAERFKAAGEPPALEAGSA